MRATCRHCGQPIHQEQDLPRIGPYWVHEDDCLTCDVEWAHPSSPDNVIIRVELAEPT